VTNRFIAREARQAENESTRDMDAAMTKNSLSFGGSTSVWSSIHSAPFIRDLELCAVDGQNVQTFDLRYRRSENGWQSVDADENIDLSPTHWRDWQQAPWFAKVFK